VRSNLAWKSTPGGSAVKYVQIGSAATAQPDVCAPANCAHNACNRPFAGNGGAGYHAYRDPLGPAMFSAPAGANDVACEPDFADPTRNLATWAVARGLTTAPDYTTRSRDGWAALMADPTRVPDAVGWVRAGFAPTNPLLQNADHETAAATTSPTGGWIGAVQGAVPVTPATAHTLTGPASGHAHTASSNFTVTPNGSFTGTITPNDGGKGGAFTPASLSWSASNVAKTFTYKPSTAGARTIATTNDGGLANPAGITYTVGAINVRDHGAVGDGVANDRAAIVAALAAAIATGIRAVYFPAGTYRVAIANTTPAVIDGIVVPGDVAFGGDGRALTTIRFDPAPGYYEWTGLQIAPQHSVSFRDLTLRGPDVPTRNPVRGKNNDKNTHLVRRTGPAFNAAYDAAITLIDCDLTGKTASAMRCDAGTVGPWTGRLLVEMRGCLISGWIEGFECFNMYAAPDAVAAFHAHDCRFEGAGDPAAVSSDYTDMGHQIYLNPNVSAILEDCSFGANPGVVAEVYAIKWFGVNPTGSPLYARLTRCAFDATCVSAIQTTSRVGPTTLIEDCVFNNRGSAVTARGSATVRNCVFNQGLTAINGSPVQTTEEERTATVVTVEDCAINGGTVAQPHTTSTLRLARCSLAGAGPYGLPRVQNQGVGVLELIDCDDATVGTILVGATTGTVTVRGCRFRGVYMGGAISFGQPVTLLTVEDNEFRGQEALAAVSRVFHTSTAGPAPTAGMLAGGGNLYRPAGWTGLYFAGANGLPGGIPASLWATYTLTGPASGRSRLASAPFTVTPGRAFTGTLTPSDGGAGGTFAPASLSWTASAAAKTFTYTPSSVGPRTVTTTNDPGFAAPPGVAYMATSAPATAYTLTGPAVGVVGMPTLPFTVTPDGSVNGTLTPSDGGAGGTFTPASLAWALTDEPKTFLYRPSTVGARTISITNTAGLADPPGVTLTARAAMTITSAQSGPWSAPSTWVGGVAPTSGDRAVILHAVTVDANTTVGDSPVPAADVITFGAADGVGKLTIADGVTLTVRGNLNNQHVTGYPLTLGAGSVYEIDSSQAVPTTTQYRIYVGDVNNAALSARIRVDGTPSARAAIRSNAGGAVGLIQTGLRPGSGFLRATCCDFTRLGAMQHDSTGRPAADLWLDRCNFTATGGLAITAGAASGGDQGEFLIQDCAFEGTTSNNPIALMDPQSAPDPAVAPARAIRRCVLDKQALFRALQGWTVEDCYLGGGVQSNTTCLNPASFRGNFAASPSGFSVIPANTRECYFVNGGNTSGQVNSVDLVQLNDTGDGEVTGNVFERATSDNTFGLIGCPAANMARGRSIAIRGNLGLPSVIAGVTGAFVRYAGAAATTRLAIEHNTHAFEDRDAILLGESAGLPAGSVTAIRSNLFWSPTATASFVARDASPSPADNAIAPGGVGRNGLQNAPLATGYVGKTNNGTPYAAPTTGATPGVGDVTVSDPMFVDATRRLATWDAALGGAGTFASAFARLKAAPSLTRSSLIPWVRAGFEPTNTALRGVDHETATAGTSPTGGWVGAVAGAPAIATAYTLTGPSSGVVNAASANFTVTPVGGPFTGTVTPNDGGAGGSFSPASLSWSNTSDAKTFTYTPSTVGARTIATTNSGGLPNPAGVAYTADAAAATAYTLIGPVSGVVNAASANFTVTPVGGPFTGTVTPSDGGVGGSFSPASLSWSNTSDAKTFTYTPSTVGARTIATTNSNGLSNPAGVAYTGSPAPATGMSLTGPTTLLVGQTTAYTLKPDGVYTGSVTLSATGAGSFSPTSLSWSGESMARTVTFTASQRGSVTLTATPTGLPAPPSIMAQAIIRPTSYTMLAASTVIQSGQTATLTFGLPPGTDPDQDIVVTPTISDGAGTFSPTTVILGPTTMTATLIYLPMRGGPHTISAANDRGLADPPSVKLSVNSSSRPKGRGYVRRLRRV
jgi:hypothetical protein